MAIQRQVRKIGGSLGIIIPCDLAELLNIREGDSVKITLKDDQIVIKKENI